LVCAAIAGLPSVLAEAFLAGSFYVKLSQLSETRRGGIPQTKCIPVLNLPVLELSKQL
jgi:hypothetical protein